MINLDEIRARCDAATPGPWKIIDKGNTVRSFAVVSESYVGIPQQMICPNMSPKTSNAEFISSARTDIPALLAYIKELEAQLAEAKADYDKAVEDIPHDCEYCQYAEVHWDKGECATCDKSEFDGEIRANNWTYRGRQGNG